MGIRKDLLIEEKKRLEERIATINSYLEKNEDVDTNEKLVIDFAPWKKDIIWQIADIFRTSPINVHYPYGYDCNTCIDCNNECTTDGDGCDCNWAFMDYIERELIKRGYYGIKSSISVIVR